MPLDLAPGVEVHVDAPAVPSVHVAPPRTDVAVVPVEGPRGPAGPGGGAGVGYVRHEQTAPTTVATVVHGLGRWPAAVTLTSLDGAVLYDEYGVQQMDLDTIRITTDTPTAYVALII